ncbi:MAG: prepilin peptidase [Anaerolineales bacterium]|nr:prepilin peptidase [Anaerolineales bacterium]
MWLLTLLFAAGLLFGAVLNSLADNLPPDADDVRHAPRRPRCPHCGRSHRPPYWLAVAGLLLQRGRCEHCGSPRRWRPVLVELAAGFVTAYLWVWAGAAVGSLPDLAVRYLAALVLVLSLILVTVIDVEHRLILWVVVWPTALAILAFSALRSLAPLVMPGLEMAGNDLVKSLLGGLAGYGVTLAIFVLAEVYIRVVRVVRGQPLEEVAFGGGDVNLAGLVGLAVGWPGVILSLTIAIVAGGLFSLVFILVQLARRRYTPHSVFPYGPFLVLGALVIYLFGKNLAAIFVAGR